MLDIPTTRVAYVKVTPTISNWIQLIAIGSAIELQVWTALRLDHDPDASVDRPKDNTSLRDRA